MKKLTVISRSYCHLCDVMIAALDRFRGRLSLTFEIEVVDIDLHPALESRWGDKVPVLLDAEQEICHYFLDEAALSAALTRAAS